MAGALEGIRVIDFGQYVAGPMAAMLLADQGADVIRIEPPGGPRFDTPANATYNRGKRSIVLDLKSAADAETGRKLVAGADVVIENFRPGVMERLGLGAEAMTAANARLIYCSLPGFAADDPRAGVRAWEGVVGAATTTYPANPRTGKPIYTPLPFSSSYAAFLCAVSVAMALNARERDGLGQIVEVPLFDATYAAIGYRGQRIHNSDTSGDAVRLARMLGVTRQFECKDGRWFMYHAGNKNAPDFAAAAGGEWLRPDSGASPDEIREKTEALFKTKTAEEWEAFCEQIGTEGSVCRTSAEWLENEHALGSKIVVDSEDPELGSVRGPGINVRMSLTPGSIRSPRPAPNQHRAEILREAAVSRPAATPSAAETMRSALDGIKVARSAFESGMRYRSACIFGVCQVLDGADAQRGLEVFTDRVLPGRTAEIRRSTARELAATLVLALPILTWSFKYSDGFPEDPAEDLAGSAWAGAVPLRTGFDDPIPNPDLRPGIDVPASVRALTDA